MSSKVTETQQASGVKANLSMLSRLMLKLLPVQILLAGVGAVDGLISSYFASNYVGVTAMSAVGLYGPINTLISAISTVLMSGAAILCGIYVGRGEREKLQKTFSLDLVLSGIISAVFILLFVILGACDLTGFFTKDPVVRAYFNDYLLGMSIGVIPLIYTMQFSSFLSLENQGKRTTTASAVHIVSAVIFNFIFVKQLHMEAFGVALSAGLSQWVSFLCQAEYFVSGKSMFRLSMRSPAWKECGHVVQVGLPGALNFIYMAFCTMIVNLLIEANVGTVGISAYATAYNVLGIFWAIPGGMAAVSRMMISISVGEEDRQTLTDVFRVMFMRYIPLMLAVIAGIVACAGPITGIFYHDPAEPVYQMMKAGLQIVPWCMPFSIICMHFSCYNQTIERRVPVYLVSLLDGIVDISVFTALLIRPLGVNALYVANILNGIVIVTFFVVYSVIKCKRLPHTMDELMVIPDDFGVPASERMDLSVRSMEEVMTVSSQVQAFCLAKGIDTRRAYLSALAIEEMAGNVVLHGFTKDRRTHSVDIRVIHSGEDLILRIKDDCRAFDPGERLKAGETDEFGKNIGIKMIYEMAQEARYQNILGLNVLTMRV